MSVYRNLVPLLFLREWHAMKALWFRVLVNELILFPIVSAMSFTVLLPAMFFSVVTPEKTAALFSGVALIKMAASAFGRSVQFLRERTACHLVFYQVSFAPLWLVYTVKIFCTAAYVFVCTAAIAPIVFFSRVQFFSRLDPRWGLFYFSLILGCLLVSTLFFAIMSFFSKFSGIEGVWPRLVEPLLYLGGYLIPWFAIAKAGDFYGWLSLSTPLLPVTESFRQCLIGGERFLSLPFVWALMSGWIIVLFALGYWRLSRALNVPN